MYKLPLSPALFTAEAQTLLQSDAFTVTTRRYPRGIESLTIANARGGGLCPHRPL